MPIRTTLTKIGNEGGSDFELDQPYEMDIFDPAEFASRFRSWNDFLNHGSCMKYLVATCKSHERVASELLHRVSGAPRPDAFAREIRSIRQSYGLNDEASPVYGTYAGYFVQFNGSQRELSRLPTRSDTDEPLYIFPNSLTLLQPGMWHVTFMMVLQVPVRELGGGTRSPGTMIVGVPVSLVRSVTRPAPRFSLNKNVTRSMTKKHANNAVETIDHMTVSKSPFKLSYRLNNPRQQYLTYSGFDESLDLITERAFHELMSQLPDEPPATERVRRRGPRICATDAPDEPPAFIWTDPVHEDRINEESNRGSPGVAPSLSLEEFNLLQQQYIQRERDRESPLRDSRQILGFTASNPLERAYATRPLRSGQSTLQPTTGVTYFGEHSNSTDTTGG